jgi:predicted Kef-type K+ transport protein
MNPMVKYSLARLGMFVLAAALVIVVPIQVNLLIKLGAAIIISAALSFFLLRGLREQVAEQLAEAAARRAASKQELRAALAGEPEPDDTTAPVADDGDQPASERSQL